MDITISHLSFYVTSHEKALAFYRDTLGWEVRNDMTAEDFRWLTVGPKTQPEFEIVLMEPGGMMDEETVGHVRAILEKGAMASGVLESKDVRRDYEELVARGVHFSQPPTERFYGIEALMSDGCGNWFSLTERPKA